jgi:hypothetical protein
MKASFLTHRRVQGAILLTVVLALASFAGCSAEARAERSLKKVVHEEIKQFNKYHKREIRHNVYQSTGGFYRVFKERVEPTITMRKTNSPGTPFVATVAFTEDTYLTELSSDSVTAQRSAHFALSKSAKSEVVYTYVGGRWRKKEVY